MATVDKSGIDAGFVNCRRKFNKDKIHSKFELGLPIHAVPTLVVVPNVKNVPTV